MNLYITNNIIIWHLTAKLFSYHKQNEVTDKLETFNYPKLNSTSEKVFHTHLCIPASCLGLLWSSDWTECLWSSQTCTTWFNIYHFRFKGCTFVHVLTEVMNKTERTASWISLVPRFSELLQTQEYEISGPTPTFIVSKKAKKWYLTKRFVTSLHRSTKAQILHPREISSKFRKPEQVD